MKSLKQLLKDIANIIRELSGTTDTINPQDFEKNLLSVSYNTFTESMVDFTGQGSDIIKNITLDDSVLTINSYAFKNFNINSIFFNEGLTTIKSYAFANNKNLKSITFSNTITTIESFAFDGCSALPEVALSSTLTAIGAAFTGCTSLTSITISEDNPIYSSRDSNIIFKEETKTLVQGCKNSTIPPDTKIIGNEAFWNIPIKTIDLSDSEVTHIETKALNSSSITTIVLSNNLTSLGINAISGTSISELNLPDSLKYLAIYGVNSNSKLQRLRFSKNISTLPVMCCTNCSSLTEVIFPEGSVIYRFDREAFSRCTSLEELIVPATFNPNDNTKTLFSSFENDVFKGCSKFKILDLSGLRGNIPTLGTGVFTGCHSDLQIKVPTGWKSDMAEMTNWADVIGKVVEV